MIDIEPGKIEDVYIILFIILLIDIHCFLS